MSATRGVLFVHSAPSALCPHIDWAVGGIFGAPVSLDWIPQPVERATYRTEYSWSGPVGTGARLASALKGWQKVRFEVTEEPTTKTEGARYSYTPTLGIFHAVTGQHGDIMVPEDRLRHAMALAAVGGGDLTRALDGLLGTEMGLRARTLPLRRRRGARALAARGRLSTRRERRVGAPTSGGVMSGTRFSFREE